MCLNAHILALIAYSVFPAGMTDVPHEHSMPGILTNDSNPTAVFRIVIALHQNDRLAVIKRLVKRLLDTKESRYRRLAEEALNKSKHHESEFEHHKEKAMKAKNI